MKWGIGLFLAIVLLTGCNSSNALTKINKSESLWRLSISRIPH